MQRLGRLLVLPCACSGPMMNWYIWRCSAALLCACTAAELAIGRVAALWKGEECVSFAQLTEPCSTKAKEQCRTHAEAQKGPKKALLSGHELLHDA